LPLPGPSSGACARCIIRSSGQGSVPQGRMVRKIREPGLHLVPIHPGFGPGCGARGRGGILRWGSTPRAEYQPKGRILLGIVPGACLVLVVPAGNCNGRRVVNVGHWGGAGNAELRPRREEAPFLAWRNEDLGPPPVGAFPRPFCRVDEEPPDFPGLGAHLCAEGGDQVPRGPALIIGQRLLAPRVVRIRGARHRDLRKPCLVVPPRSSLRARRSRRSARHSRRQHARRR